MHVLERDINEDKILYQLTHNGKPYPHYMFWCEGCGHLIDERWTFNGNFITPTFSPSYLIKPIGGVKRCHLYIKKDKYNI